VPRLSILIPCLGGPAEFDGTLVSVLQHRPPKSEVIVAHTASYDDPYHLASEVDFLHCPHETTLAGLVNEAAEVAASPIVHVLACGLEATDGWTEASVRHFADDEVAAVVPAVMTADASRLVSAGVRLSAAGSRTVQRNEQVLAGGSAQLRAAIGAPTLTAGFYRRDVLEVVGGFDRTAGDFLADVDLALKLRTMELRTVLEPAGRVLQSNDPLARSTTSAFMRGRTAERLFWRNAADIGWPLALVLHGLTAMADPLAIPGRMVALLEIGSAQRHGRHLIEAAERLAQMRASKAQVKPTPMSITPRRMAA
jgi:hypothetical protein